MVNLVHKNSDINFIHYIYRFYIQLCEESFEDDVRPIILLTPPSGIFKYIFL